jgi:hypothetical protein
MSLKNGSKPVSPYKWIKSSFLLFALLQAPLLWAVDTHIDTDGDGSDDVEEILAGTDPTNPDERPYWWKTFNGDSSGDSFGSSVSGAGDVNGDGYDDIVIGAWADDNNGSASGSARVLSGLDGSVLYTFNGDSAFGKFGHSVSGAGDVNNDGYADIVIGAYTDDNNGASSGSAQVLSGQDGSVLYSFNGDSAGDYFGASVSGAGDVNNDGYADIVVGANGDENNGTASGSARVFSGQDGSVLYTFNGVSAYYHFGRSVSGAGDVNNDGYADILVGVPGESLGGSARVFSGQDGSLLYTFNGDSSNDQFGSSVSGAGDVNNDGYADIVIGAYADDNNGLESGSTRVLSGLDGSRLYTFNGDSADNRFGSSVSGAGDVNGDGYADILVGAYGDDSNGADSGSARLFSGLDGSVLFTFKGDNTNDRFGLSVSGAGDVNNDGYADIVVRASNGDNNGGSVRVILSSDLHNDMDLDFQLNGADLDADGDGVNNDVDSDNDNDGISDAIENTYAFLDPLNALDAAEDFDQDGFSNLDELEQGTAPDDINDRPVVELAVKSDFDGDGIADIFWRNAIDGSAEIAIGNGGGAIARTESLNSKSADWSAQLGDFNGDGAVDTLWRNSMTGAVKVAISDANGNQGTVHNLAAKGSAWLTQIGDFNGDGRDDILWRKPSEGFVRVGISNVDGDQQRIEYFFDKGEAWAAFVGDFNGDGRDDMLWRRGTDGASKIILSDANGAQANVVNVLAFPRFSAWQVQIGDVNNDGRDDILWRKSSDGTVKIGISGADGKQASSVNHFAKFMAWTATLGDFNGDGGADILWRKPADGTVKIAITGAAGEQASVVGLPARFSAWVQQLADYNGDGRTDILWHKPVTGEVMLGISSPMGYQQSEVSMDNKPSGWTVVH